MLKLQRNEAERLYRIIVALEHSSNFSKDYEMEVNDFNIEKIDLPPGVHTTTCTFCNRTCHDNCVYANNSDKIQCVAMANGNCTRCLNKCFWDKHANLPFIYKESTVKVKKTISEL